MVKTQRLFYEFCGMSFESFLADETAEMVGFALISDFEFSSILVKNHAANWISKRHYFF